MCAIRQADQQRTSAGAGSRRKRGSLLIVDSDRLAQWSVATFLKPWFELTAIGTTGAALQFLEQHRVQAVVISDECGDAVVSVEELARRHNPDAVIVRTVTGVSSANCPAADVVCIEKPFDLRKLAGLLGVPESETR